MLRFMLYLVLHCSGIGLSLFVLYRTSLFLDCKGPLPSFATRGRRVLARHTPLAKEGTNEIWPAISQFFEESWVLLHAPKLGHGTDYNLSHVFYFTAKS
jgi:hypothetical protein